MEELNPQPEQIRPKLDKWKILSICLAILFIVVSLAFAIYFYKNQNIKQDLEAKKTEVIEPKVYERNLVGYPYLGELWYETDGNSYEKFIFKKNFDKGTIVLYEGEFDEGSIDTVLISPDESKYIIKRHLGDAGKTMLLRRTATSGTMEVLDFGGTYGNAISPVSWISEEKLLIKNTKSNFDTGVDTVSYWITSVDDLNQKAYLSNSLFE